MNPASISGQLASEGRFCTTVLGTSRAGPGGAGWAGDEGKDQSTEASPSFPRSSLSLKCLMSLAPSIGTGSPICSQGAGRSWKRQPTRRPNARDYGVGGRAPPHQTPTGVHFNSPAARLGNFRLPVVTVPIPLPLGSPHGQMATWKRGELPGGFPGPRGEGQRCQPPGPSPILFASKFLSNTFWGFPQSPTPDLSWQVWVPLLLPWEGWNRIKSWGFSRPYVQEGEGVPSGHSPACGQVGWGSSLPHTCTASPHLLPASL